MSVVVMGLEMPTVCIEGGWYGNCPMDRLWCAQRFAPEGYTMRQINADRQDKLPGWCPLRPMPEKHGPMIDCQALLEEARRLSGPFVGDGWSNQRVFALIARQPTIVEAEGDD